MISCTEFIPLYSEFFKFLDTRSGHDAVVTYWNYISDNSIGDLTNPNSLAYKCEKLGGYEGAMAYWGHTLTEEACDLLKIFDNKNKFCYEHMRHCPSKGMLNDLKHIEPYYDYCQHCNIIYQRVLEKYGMVYEMDHSKVSEAQCRALLYPKNKKPEFDFANMNEEELEGLIKREKLQVVDMKTEDNKYLHRDFHLLGDLALKYCGETFGDAAVTEFLTSYTLNYYSPQINEIKSRGLIALKEWIEAVYEKEEASYLLHTELSENTLCVVVEKSPVIEYMKSLNQEPSKYYIEETQTLYSVIANASNLSFKLEYYASDGAAKFTFAKLCKSNTGDD